MKMSKTFIQEAKQAEKLLIRNSNDIVKLLGLGFDFTFTCQGENHCNPWRKPLQPLDKTTATLG